MSAPDNTGGKQDTRFKPGQSGNPNGRPRGARNKLSRQFLDDLVDVWSVKGRTALEKLADERPQDFVRSVVALQPKQIEVERPLEELSDSELAELISAVRSISGVSSQAGGGTGDQGEAELAEELQSLH